MNPRRRALAAYLRSLPDDWNGNGVTLLLMIVRDLKEWLAELKDKKNG
jgi:hypothetical protein